MQSGTPVITCHNSSLKEVGGNAVVYTSTEDPEELAQHITELLKDASVREELSKKGLQQAERFSKEKHEERLFELYRALIA